MKSLIVSVIIACSGAIASGADWPQFRGPNGNGTAAATLPDTWGDDENIIWKAELPGVGASTPVIVGNKLFLTAGTGGAADLVRHVLCFDVASGRKLWDRTVKSQLPEQEKIREDHGYTSATPVATATHVFVFFGKSGVFCFDHSGQEIWNRKVGSGLNGWGSAASLTLNGSALLVNASVESESLVALDQAKGDEIWKVTGIRESWHAPVVATTARGTEVIIALAGQVRSFDAATGQVLWQCRTGISWYMCPQPLVQDGVVYAVGGRSGTGGLAVKLGGTGDVTDSHKLWTLQKGTNVPSPLVHDGHLYFAHENLGIAHCVELSTGKFIYSERLTPNPGQIYASPVLAGDRICYLGRSGQAVMVRAAPRFEVLSSARLENGRGVFNASPAIADGRLFIRSNRFLYCIGSK